MVCNYVVIFSFHAVFDCPVLLAIWLLAFLRQHENIIHKSHLSYKGDGTRIWPGTAKNEEHLLENAGKASTYFHKLKQVRLNREFIHA